MRPTKVNAMDDTKIDATHTKVEASIPVSSRQIVMRISSLDEEDTGDDYLDWTPAERLSIMWQHALDCWSILDPKHAEARIRRDVVSIERRRS